MLPGMRRPCSSIHWSRVIALPLALWSTVPGIQWCRVGWAEVRAECFVACSIEPSGCPQNPGGAAASPTEGSPEASAACPPSPCGPGAIAANGCPAGSGTCTLGPCDPGGDSGEWPAGGRAYCLSGPSGGDGVPPLPPGAGPPVAVVPATILRGTPDTGAARPMVFTVASPSVPTAGAVPRIRAPPLTRLTTC